MLGQGSRYAAATGDGRVPSVGAAPALRWLLLAGALLGATLLALRLSPVSLVGVRLVHLQSVAQVTAVLAVALGVCCVALRARFVRQRRELFAGRATAQEAVASLEQRARRDREELAHELRSGLSALAGGIRNLESTSEHTPAQREALLGALAGETERLRRLIERERPEERSLFGVADVLQPLVALYSADGVRVTCHVAPDLVVIGRPGDLTQVLRNLLDNARKHAPGSPVAVCATHARGQVVLRVEDQGPGVPGDQRGLIFERGWRASPDASAPSRGLGLHVARGLVRAQGGDVWVELGAGGGASFALSLPGWRSSTPPAEPPPGAQAVDQLDQRREVVDGDPPVVLRRLHDGGVVVGRTTRKPKHHRGVRLVGG